MTSSRNRNAVLFVAVTEILVSSTFLAAGGVLCQTLSKSILSVSNADSDSDSDSDSLGLNADIHRFALYLHVFTYLLLLFMSGFGFQSALRRRRTQVSLFFSMTFAQYLLAIASGVFCLVLLFQPPLSNYEACSNLDQFSRMFCEHSGVAKGLSVALFIQVWVVELVGLYYTQAYSQQLLEEDQKIVKDMYDF